MVAEEEVTALNNLSIRATTSDHRSSKDIMPIPRKANLYLNPVTPISNLLPHSSHISITVPRLSNILASTVMRQRSQVTHHGLDRALQCRLNSSNMVPTARGRVTHLSLQLVCSISVLEPLKVTRFDIQTAQAAGKLCLSASTTLANVDNSEAASTMFET